MRNAIPAVLAGLITAIVVMSADNSSAAQGASHPRGVVAVDGAKRYDGFRPAVLVFSKTTGFRHDSIPDGIAAIQQLGQENGFDVDATEDSGVFTDETLSGYQAVIFLLTTGTVLDQDQKDAFERFIEAGNGYVGVHSASDTEYDWTWYGQLLGAYFSSHPAIQTADVDVEDHNHVSTWFLPDVWQRTDEWYNFRTNPRDSGVTVLATLDEMTYFGGTMGDDHPIMWYQEFDGGRSWYTAMGHTRESYYEDLFLECLL
ncbi:MAG TPA: ThuA domain-containing protein, partial [Gemmataceae bacterium]|nr:ThuA domain-containing protein [Gemmataceae bacterium]